MDPETGGWGPAGAPPPQEECLAPQKAAAGLPPISTMLEPCIIVHIPATESEGSEAALSDLLLLWAD